MERPPIRIIVLTSSRADFGIYMPLLEELNKDSEFNLSIIAFGTHVSDFHGNTITEIAQCGFTVKYSVESLICSDTDSAISTSIGVTLSKFSTIWNIEKNNIDLIFALGDRFEMFAAVAAAVPFKLPIAHFHGGETSLGSFDNHFRHCITIMSSYHFTATRNSAQRVKQLVGSDDNIFQVGALSLDKITRYPLLSIEEFCTKYAVDLTEPTILFTYHPETIIQNSKDEIDTLVGLLKDLQFQILITLPNADPGNTYLRSKLLELASDSTNIFAVESLGSIGYFSAMQHCLFLMGNSSSGIIEAASFNKYAINIGNRQLGREAGTNVLHTPLVKEEIYKRVQQVIADSYFRGSNIYGNGQSVDKVITILKSLSYAR